MKRTFLKYSLQCLTVITALSACQDFDEPALGQYPTDAPIQGDLKFLAAFESNFVEELKQSIGKGGTGTTFIEGVNGKAVSFNGSSTGLATFKSTNDFKNATSFTLSYWLKVAEPTTSGAHFIFSMPTTNGHWSGGEFFQLIEDKGQSNSGKMATKFMFFDNWLEYVGDNKVGDVMDNKWHHWTVTYNETNSTLSVFVDGKKLEKSLVLKREGQNLGKANLSKSTKFVVGAPPHSAIGKTPDSWMVTMEGGLDQFRMFNRVLSDTEIVAIFSAKN